MLVFTGTWISDIRSLLGRRGPAEAEETLGILAFEAAKAMSRLVSLHRALSDSEISKLRSDTMRSHGVSNLNSTDQRFLLRLACAEMIDELDRAAAAVSRLASRCSSAWPRAFDQVYAELKSGSADFDRRLGFPAKKVEKKMTKMEVYVAATSTLHAEMETLAEMEASERKLERWRNYSGPITVGATTPPPPPQNPPGAEAFMKKLAAQRKVVRRLQEESSLWGQKTEKVAELMARAAVTVFARICHVFAASVAELPVVDSDRSGRIRAGPNPQRIYPKHVSGPLDRPRASSQKWPVKFSGPILRTPAKADSKPWTAQVLLAPPNTVGGAGLALRYADVVALAEKMFQAPELAGEDERDELYQMLNGGIRAAVRGKLRSCWKEEGAAEKWREEAGRVLGWLAPMAADTIKWYSERSCEKQKLETKPKVLMLQTLYVSDRRKVEAAVVDVLVGLSFVYQEQLQGGGGGGGGWREGLY